MSQFTKKVAIARAALIISLEQALSTLGDGFVTIGQKLRSEDQDAETRATFLTSADASKLYTGAAFSVVTNLVDVAKEFDRIETESERAPVKYQVYMETDKYADKTNPGQLDLLIGKPALLKHYLLKAGYKLDVELFNGYYFYIVITRP